MITKETQRYIRHASKMSGQPLTPKDADMTNSLNALHAEIDALSAEKIVLAERLVKLFERAMARLQHDLQRILKLQGDEPGLPPTQHFLSTLDSTVQQLQTNLRAASVVAETPTVSTPVPPPPQKSTCFFQFFFFLLHRPSHGDQPVCCVILYGCLLRPAAPLCLFGREAWRAT